MKTITAILIVAFLSATVGMAHADCANKWCGDVTITEIYPNTTGNFARIQTSGDELALSNCTPETSGTHAYLRLRWDDPRAQDVYRTLLAAFLAGTRVVVRTKDSSPTCEIAYVRLRK